MHEHICPICDEVWQCNTGIMDDCDCPASRECDRCLLAEREATDAGDRWADEHERGNGYPSGTIGSETR